MSPTPYTRIVRFQRIGLHTNVADLVAQVRTHDDGRGPYIVRSLDTLIADYVRPFLAHDGVLHIDVDPDQRNGRAYGTRSLAGGEPTGEPLAQFTVHLDTEELPPRGVDHDEVREIARMVLPVTHRMIDVRSCRTGCVVRVHSGYTERVRDVLIGAGYHAHLVDNVVLVAVPDQS
jgi:hypothetical protein